MLELRNLSGLTVSVYRMKSMIINDHYTHLITWFDESKTSTFPTISLFAGDFGIGFPKATGNSAAHLETET